MNVHKCTKCNTILQRIEGTYALTKVIKDGNNIAFNPSSGIPVVCYFCPICGEIKIFSAKLLGEI